MLWSPSKDFVEQSNLRQYTKWLAKNKNLLFEDYHDLWQWSISNLEEFWQSIWEYFNIVHEGDHHSVLEKPNSFFGSWFEGTYLNYAEHIFRKATDQQPAIVFKNESGHIQEISWKELLND